MPYAEKQDQQEFQAAWYVVKYWTRGKFRKAESSRKAEWFAKRMEDPEFREARAAKAREAYRRKHG
jgi:hypothetical protein